MHIPSFREGIPLVHLGHLKTRLFFDKLGSRVAEGLNPMKRRATGLSVIKSLKHRKTSFGPECESQHVHHTIVSYGRD